MAERIPRLTREQLNNRHLYHDPHAVSSASRRWQVAQQARRLGHKLGPWEPEDNQTTFARRAECERCGAEVFVDWRGPGEGWQRAASIEIQQRCTNDLHSPAARAKAYVDWKLYSFWRQRLEQMREPDNEYLSLSDTALAEAIATEVTKRLEQYNRLEVAALVAWNGMLSEQREGER